MSTYSIIGVMSGTSLDGVDLAHCTFHETNGQYSYEIGACETIPYPETWLSQLKQLPQSTALEYAMTHTLYGRYLGKLIHDFASKNQIVVDFVASHGHTIFHNPAKQYTSQIGEGAAIASGCGFPLVCDFRTTDVAAGGQGAPLVPIGDELLFANYDYCLNLGGFANISMKLNNNRIAFDISPANIILNHLANQQGKPYDKNGEMAESGIIHNDLFQTLNNLRFYHMKPPKSLGREWVEKEVLPLLTFYNISVADAACTFCEHISFQITRCIDSNPQQQMLITGGGAFNSYLIHRIAEQTRTKLIIPEEKIINYKESLVFAFLGLLRMKSKPNCLATVTGALRNVTGGAVYLP